MCVCVIARFPKDLTPPKSTQTHLNIAIIAVFQTDVLKCVPCRSGQHWVSPFSLLRKLGMAEFNA